MVIKPSPCLAVLLLLFHAMAAAVVSLTEIQPLVRLALLLAILSSLSYYLARDALLLLPGSWREITPDLDGVSVITKNGSTFTGEVSGQTSVIPCFIVLRTRPEGRHFPISRTIFPDMLGRDEFRELRVQLRFARKRP